MNDSRATEKPILTLIRVVRQRALLVVIALITVPAVAYFVSNSKDDRYTATAKLLLSEPAATDSTDSIVDVGVTDLDAAATNLDLAALRTVARRAAGNLGEDITPAEVQRSVEVLSRGESSVLDVQAERGKPESAADIANAYAAEYVEFRRERAADQYEEALATVQTQIDEASDLRAQGLPHADIRTLRDRADELRLEADLQTGGAELVERAQTPGSPSSPKPRRAAALGLGFGLLIGVGLALLMELLSRRLNDAHEVEGLYDAPILGVIPRTSYLADGRLDPLDIPMGERNAFQNVRTNLRYFNDYNVGSALVLSSGPEEGKTTVAWNIAVAAAEAGIRALLLEADLRAPSIAVRSGIRSEPGLQGILDGQVDVEQAIQRVPVDRSFENGRGPTTLDVITAGRPLQSPTRLIESPQLPRLIMTLEEWYDLVIIDAPPALVVPDAISMIDHIGGVIVVSRVRKDTRDAALALRRALENIGAPVLGVVINGVGPPEGLYDYGYGYEPQARDVGAAV